jgi:alpha-L-fucosidase
MRSSPTKRHDGFCLYDGPLTGFKLPVFLPGRDLVREFVEGCRKRHLKVGLYLSNFDWNEPGYFEPERYPESEERLVSALHLQTEELLTRYGKIDLLWFDGSWVSTGYYKVNEADFWPAPELLARIYELQPHILVNNRLGVEADLDTPK